MGKESKAFILGWLATIATFFACGCLSGAVVFVVALVWYDDHRPDDGSSNMIAVLTVMSLVLGLRFSLRFGRLVGQDWYRKGEPRP